MTISPPAPRETKEQKLERMLRTDDAFYAESLLYIVDQEEHEIKMRLKPAQRKFLAIKARQEAERKPVRIIVLKARKEGISTMVQACMIKRLTQRPNHLGVVVAHDGDSAEKIFEMGERMWRKLPDERVGSLQLKPPKYGGRTGSELLLGEPSRARRDAGDVGINSAYVVDTANNYDAGHGMTPFTLHCSEFSRYQNPEKKAKALFNSVPDTPATMIVLESTADGYNMFRRLWLAAETGRSNYAPLFIAWFEDPQYSQPFANPEERARFVAEELGTGEYGEGEPALMERGVSLEQLKWRRWAIENKAAGDIRTFWEQYPASPDEAFLSSGRQVFAAVKVSKIIERTEQLEPQVGLIRARSFEDRAVRGDVIRVPRQPFWLPEAEVKASGEQVGIATPRWSVWEPPFTGLEEQRADDGEIVMPLRPPGQYVLTVDSASGAETASEGQDYFAIQVINHRTRMQCAVWHARGIDADLVAEQAYLAALWYAPEFRGWIGVETTGGYGLSIARRLYKAYRYPVLYFRTPANAKGEKAEDRLGFSMDKSTKPLVVDGLKELIRTGRDGIRHRQTAAELLSFVRDEKGAMGAEEDYFDDLADSYMVGQFIASEKPVRRSKFGAVAREQALRRAPSMRRGRLGR